MLQNITNITTNKTVKSQYTTRPTEICDELELYLNRIFEKELAEPNSVLLAYNPFVIKKIAGYLSGKIKMPASIGIAGETASGKSTITKDLIDTIESFATEFGVDNAITRVNTDDYYSQMGVAWAIATIMSKYPEKCLEYLQSNSCNLNKITYNKSLQKIRESLKISDEIKILTRKMKKV